MFMKIYNKELAEKLRNSFNTENISVYDYRFKIPFQSKDEATSYINMVSEIFRDKLNLQGYIDFLIFEYKDKWWLQVKDVKCITTSSKIKKREYGILIGKMEIAKDTF